MAAVDLLGSGDKKGNLVDNMHNIDCQEYDIFTMLVLHVMWYRGTICDYTPAFCFASSPVFILGQQEHWRLKWVVSALNLLCY